MNVFHGEQRQFVGAVRIAAVFHVPRDGEQLDRCHDVRCCVDDDLVRRFEGDRVAFAQIQRVQCAVGRILSNHKLSLFTLDYIIDKQHRTGFNKVD